jgi:hypothetical protein
LTGECCLLKEEHEKTFLSQQDSVAQVLHGKRRNQWLLASFDKFHFHFLARVE